MCAKTRKGCEAHVCKSRDPASRDLEPRLQDLSEAGGKEGTGGVAADQAVKLAA